MSDGSRCHGVAPLKELIGQAQRQGHALRDHAFGTPEEFVAKASLLELVMPLAGKVSELVTIHRAAIHRTPLVECPECDWIIANGYTEEEW